MQNKDSEQTYLKKPNEIIVKHHTCYTVESLAIIVVKDECINAGMYNQIGD